MSELLSRYSVMPISGQLSRPIILGALWTPPVGIRRSSVRSDARAVQTAANRVGDPPRGEEVEGSRLRSLQQRPAGPGLDRGPDPAVSEADRAGRLGLSPCLHGPGDERRERVAPGLPGASR